MNHGGHALGGAGHDEIAGLQFPGGRQMLDGFGNIPDQLADVAALAVCAIDLQRDFSGTDVARLISGSDGADGG